MIQFSEKYPLATISILILLMLLIHLNVPSITIMEARNFITAREMILDDHWLLTTLNGEPRYQKPPLPTWLTAFSGYIFGGNNMTALRLPAALMVLLSGICVYFLSLKLLLSKEHSFNNSLILATSFYVIAIINEAPWDIYAHGFMLVGLYFLFKTLREHRSVWKNLMISAIFTGFSILSKGPVSLYALFLPFLISYGIVFKYKGLKFKILPLIIYVILFLIIGGWWYIYVRLADPVAFLKIAGKETGNWSAYNVKPFYYYWSFFTQSGIWTIPAFISLIYPYLIRRVVHKKAYQFTFWWTIIAVVLLSVIPEKKARYLMPVLIPLALNTGFYIQHLFQKFKNLRKKRETIPVYFNFGLIAGISLALPIILYVFLKDNLQDFLFSYVSTSLVALCIGVLMIRSLYRKIFRHTFYLTVLFVATLFVFGLPISKNLNKNKSYSPIFSLHKLEKDQNFRCYSIGEITPELLWDYNGKIRNIYKNEALEVPSAENFGILMMNKDVDTILTQLKISHTVQHLKTFNMNTGSKNKERLVRQCYLISKK